MKILLPNQSKQGIGGGWTFLNTFDKFARRAGHHIAVDEHEADVILISGATMLSRDYVQGLKALGKKIVLRVDNIPRNSRNRNTGTPRLYDFAQLADLVIYQSQWARDFIKPFLKKDGPVILNGADETIFNTEGSRRPPDGKPQCLFTQYNRDETKRWHEAWYHYQMIHRVAPEAHLWIVGQFSPELQASKFDFFMGERHEYVGVVESPAHMAEIYRGTDVLLLPYYNDACSNTLIEARLCGVKDLYASKTGGNAQILAAPLEELTASRMVEKYVAEFSKL